MSWKPGQKARRGKKTSWGVGGDSPEAPRHRWQVATSDSDVDRKHRRRSRNRWAVMTLMALALLAFLIWMLFPKPMTPLVAIAATNYEVPVPINAWALEDRQALEKLDGKNLELLGDHRPDWNEAGSHFEVFPKAFDPSQFGPDIPLIVYLSAHGVVKEDGEPCVLPPGVSINDPKNWKSVAQLLDEIDHKVGSKRDTLLVLDCNRIRVNWRLGIVYNTFAERVEELVNRKKASGEMARLAVLTSAGPGQVNWTSADFRGSVFARYLQLGLAGAADEKVAGGNDNGKVSLQELFSYLKHEVSAWSQFNRGERQEPMLVPKDADFRVTNSLRSRQLHKLVEQFEEPGKSDTSDSNQSLSANKELWSKLDGLRERHLARFNPTACSNLEHQLLRWEELSQGGEEYAKQAEELLKIINDQLSKPMDAPKFHVEGNLHTLPSCTFFGLCDATQSEQIRSIWTKLLDVNYPGPADSIIDSADRPEPARKLARQLAETHFFAALRQQQVKALWPKEFKWDKVRELHTKADELAVPADTSGIPFDERAHYYVRVAAAMVDDERRLAEDLLFVGGQNAPQQYENHARESEVLSEWARQVMSGAMTAFQVRDRVLAEVPYLSEWVCDPLSVDVKDHKKLSDSLLPLIDGVHVLNKEVNFIEQTRDSKFLLPKSKLTFDSLESVASSFDAIRKPIETGTLLLGEDSMEDVREWRTLEAALKTPLIPGPIREKLLTNRAKLAADLHAEYFNPKRKEATEKISKGEESSHGDREPARTYAKTVRSWKIHPLLGILQVAAPTTTDDLAWCDKAAEIVRQCLAGQRGVKSEAKDERQRLSTLETDLRTKSAFVESRQEKTSDEIDPVAELRHFDVAQLLVWQAQRAFKDFWRITADPGRPFFAQAADDYLQAAKKISPNPVSRAQVTDGERKLKARETEAGSERLPIKARVDPAPESAGAFDVSLNVGDASHPIRYAKGYAAIFIQDGPRRLTDLQPQRNANQPERFVVLPFADGKPQQFHVKMMGNSADVGPSLEAVTFFRGRESADRFDLPVDSGIRIEYEPYQYTRQSVTLSGDRAQRSSIEFILDCSKSMEELAETGEGSTDQRLKLAKTKLRDMLDKIAQRNNGKEDIHVGVWFYGHRVAWEVDAKNIRVGDKTQVQPNFKPFQDQRDFPKYPSDDVERILTVGVFNDVINGYIKSRLTPEDDKILKPWGETPLYLALVRGLADFAKEESDRRKCIVAITDGINDTDAATTKDQVITAASNTGVQIYILGFDIRPSLKLTGQALQEEQAKIDNAIKEFKEIAAKTNGQFVPIHSGTQLINTLEEQLDTDSYRVRESGRPPVKLNTLIPIDDSLLGKSLNVSFRSAAKGVQLQGGEAIQLYVAGSGQDQKIVAKPYEAGEKEAHLIDRQGESPFILRAHRPRVDADAHSVQFPISIQRDPDQGFHFTERPAETWVEITPSTKSAQPYVFYDENFVPDEPVPVLKWTALNWPSEADHAHIQFWCKLTPTNGTKFSLHELLTAARPLPAVPGVELAAESKVEGGKYVVRVKELHVGTQSPDIYDQRIRLVLDPALHAKPSRVVHVFDAQQHIATHSYFFPAEMRENIERNQKTDVVITNAKDLKDGALQLPDGGLTVPVSPAAAVFPPSATVNGR